jgi:predicted acetyltransferase
MSEARGIEIRPPTEGDREAIARVMRLSFPIPLSHMGTLIERLWLPSFLCAFRGPELVATTAAHPLSQWFGGRAVPMAGVAAVATVPELRGTGVGSALVAEALRAARDRGTAISTLYPATVPVYRRLGYEYAGLYTQYRTPLLSLPRAAAGSVEEVTVEELEGIRACYRSWAGSHSGPIDSDFDEWWRQRVFREGYPDEVGHAAVVRGAGGVEGYVVFRREDDRGDAGLWGIRVACQHLVGTTPASVAALLGYLRRFQGIGTDLQWQGPPSEPLGLLLPEQTLRSHWVFRFMTRLLDVSAAFESRGYRAVNGEAVFCVEDDLFSENRGPFRLEADRGTIRVSPIEGPVERPIPVGALSAMYTGYLSPTDLARVGRMDADHPAAPLLGDLLGGPTPWMQDFF